MRKPDRQKHRGAPHGGPPRGGQPHGTARPKGDDARRPPARLVLAEGALRIWGTHALEAVLANPRRKIARLLLTEAAASRLGATAKARGIAAMLVDPRDLDRAIGSGTVHQGAVAEVEPLPEPTLGELIERAATGGPIVVLDQVTDPHNVGAILRSAAVFGATGLVMTRHHSPPLDGALAKAASGALELVPIVLAANLARAMDDMADAFVRRIGLDGAGEAPIDAEPFEGAVALVLGAEGKGLRRLTREHCDTLCRIGAAGGLASLNVSNAAAVALYAASRRRTR